MNTPIAKKIAHTFNEHGIKRTDNFFWLREKTNQEVLDYVDAENDYTNNCLKGTESLQNDLFEEMKGRIKQDDSSVPYLKNGYWYYTRFEKGSEHAIYCRKKASLDNTEEILLDENILAKEHPYYEIVSLSISPDNKTLAFGEDITGRRIYQIQFKNLENGKNYRDLLTSTSSDLAWMDDSKTLFYSLKEEETLRPHQVMKHVLNSPEDNDEIIFTETDDTFITGVSKDKLGRFIFIGSWSTLTTEYQLLDLENTDRGFEIFHPRTKDLEYYPEASEKGFYIKHNRDGENFSMSFCSYANTKIDNWSTIHPHNADLLIEDFEVFKSHLVVQEKENGLTQLRVFNTDDYSNKVIPPKEEAFMLYVANNPNYDTEIVRIGYSSMTTPSSVIDINLNDFTENIKKVAEVVGDFDSSNYKSERIWAIAADGIKVPMSLVYNKNTFKKDRNNPVLVYGYGSYGHTIDPHFSSDRLSLLDRGFVFVICHIRGSEYLGRNWYEDGKFLKKMNTFTDFIACTKHLISENYCDPAKVFASGGSAGGLLMGAIVNLEPSLWRGIVSNVPFVDVVTTMMDDTIPLTTGEYEEWGNPNDKAYYEYMLSYSPYDNIEAKPYPNMLITSGLHDSQVQYWEPTKYVAKLRDLKTDNNLLLLKTNTDAGHGGSAGRFEHLKEIALDYAFIIKLNKTELF
jgi:oligopeptidase B